MYHACRVRRYTRSLDTSVFLGCSEVGAQAKHMADPRIHEPDVFPAIVEAAQGFEPYKSTELKAYELRHFVTIRYVSR